MEANIRHVNQKRERIGSQVADLLRLRTVINFADVEGSRAPGFKPHGVLLQLLLQVLYLGEGCTVIKCLRVCNERVNDFLSISSRLFHGQHVVLSQKLSSVVVNHVAVVLLFFHSHGSCCRHLFIFWRVCIIFLRTVEPGEELMGNLALRLLDFCQRTSLAINDAKDGFVGLADDLADVNFTLV